MTPQLDIDPTFLKLMTRSLQVALRDHERVEHGADGGELEYDCAEDVARRMLQYVDAVAERIDQTAAILARADEGTVH